jgi:tetraprenyl-beta-curcumene synthase
MIILIINKKIQQEVLMQKKLYPIKFMYYTYKYIFPAVHKYLDVWKERAIAIPNLELRKQALASINTKTFHCEGGAIFAFLTKNTVDDCVRFVVAFQTISDYLDNLCDRSTSLDPEDFTQLHKSMEDALNPDAPLQNYYMYREEQNDGGYLHSLVQECQGILRKIKNYDEIMPLLTELNALYNDLQVHKHVRHDEREDRLLNWFGTHREKVPPMTWYEFSACTGSTLAIFCMVAYALKEEHDRQHFETIFNGYFPFIQGVHILLDYLIDIEEDKAGGDLNFCTYYEKLNHLYATLKNFYQRAKEILKGVVDYAFHCLVLDSLFAMYLADPKVSLLKVERNLLRKIRAIGGFNTKFFYWNVKAYRKLKPHKVFG